jgi:hypothetical protein
VPDLSNGVCRCGSCAEFDDHKPTSAETDRVEVIRLAVRPSKIFALWSTVHDEGPTRPFARHLARRAVDAVASVARVVQEVDSDWRRVVLARARRELATGAFDALWTTSAPFKHLAIGSQLAREFGVPWIADLRDPVSRYRFGSASGRAVVRLRRARYRKDLSTACARVATTPEGASLDEEWCGRPIDTITSGFDPTTWDAARSAATVPIDVFEIVYAGVLYRRYQRPHRFLQGFRLFLDGLEPAEQRRVKIVYYGRDASYLLETASQFGVAHHVEDRGFVPINDIRRAMASAHVLLLVTNEIGESGVPGGKLYEYLGSMRPILAVPAADRFVNDVLAETGAGVTADTAQEVATALGCWFASWSDGHRPTTRDRDVHAVERFSMVDSARALAKVLERCAPPSRGMTGSAGQGPTRAEAPR